MLNHYFYSKQFPPINSTLTVNNSIHEIEQVIEEIGGEDKEALYEILNDVTELIENIQIKEIRYAPHELRSFGYSCRRTGAIPNWPSYE